jgi:serine phosphatase RsbU (regulator of sigma subunit)
MLGNKRYFVLVKRADTEWKTVEVYDEFTAFSPLRKTLFLLISLQLFTVLITALSISLACKNTLSPLKDVISAVHSISSGNFDVNIQTKLKGEIASLFESVNQTAMQLKQLLADKLVSALNRSQMETAQSIQQSFLVQDLPQTSYSQVAASFKPAYDIGADWYDAIQIEGVMYTVVADVCDKGVPSALFMSVFRSLLRYTLTKNALDDDTENVTDLANVMTLVNDYMSSTHGISAMFATVFVSAYDPSKNTLSYVTCGHELPFILRASGQLDILEVCGPAIGIFEGANFIIKNTPFDKGDILFSYTDGLVDARSPEGKSFGYEATKAILVGLSEAQKYPQVIVDLVNNIVNDHMDGADQFDDLTILALKAI